jgi:putative transcriptional regulator
MRKLLAVLALVLSSGAVAQDLDRTLMLVATPDLEGAYRHTALVVMPLGDNRHLGFIVNRASAMRFASSTLYYGGPQMVDALFAMVRNNPGEPSLHLFGDVFVTGDSTLIERIVGETPDATRLFAGFVGWEPGELADEIDAGYWYVGEPDAAQVFSAEPGESLWADLVKRMGRRLQTRR